MAGKPTLTVFDNSEPVPDAFKLELGAVVLEGSITDGELEGSKGVVFTDTDHAVLRGAAVEGLTHLAQHFFEAQQFDLVV